MTITVANDMASVNYSVSGMARAADNAGIRGAFMCFRANADSVQLHTLVIQFSTQVILTLVQEIVKNRQTTYLEI